MNMKTVLMGLMVAAALNVQAENVYRFDDFSKANSDWMDGRNWRIQTADDAKGQVPGEQDTVRFNYGGKSGFLSGDAGSILKLQIGIDARGGTLILNPGARLIVSDNMNYIGWNGIGEGGALIVNGGMLEYNGWVSVANEGKGTFILNDGTVRVANTFYHNLYNVGGMSSTQIQGGVLDVNKMTLNSGVLDISGGLVRIRTEISEQQIQDWVERGLITFKGKTGGVKGMQYSLSDWESNGLEIRVATPPHTLGLVCY